MKKNFESCILRCKVLFESSRKVPHHEVAFVHKVETTFLKAFATLYASTKQQRTLIKTTGVPIIIIVNLPPVTKKGNIWRVENLSFFLSKTACRFDYRHFLSLVGVEPAHA